LVESIRSWVADLLGIAAVVVAVTGFVLGRRELRRQQEILKATNHAVEQAIDDLRARHLSASLGDVRWALADFQRSCRESDWSRATFGGDRLRSMMIRTLSVRGLSEREHEKLRLAVDDIRVIQAKIHHPEPKLSSQNLKALDLMLDDIDHTHGRRTIPAVSVGAHNE
jgi:hypothetical protein